MVSLKISYQKMVKLSDFEKKFDHVFRREQTKWTANPKKHPHFKWTANLTYKVNGHELLRWTATNSWGERPRTFGVNGHELLGWTAKTPVVNGQTAMNGQFAVKNHELVCEIVPY